MTPHSLQDSPLLQQKSYEMARAFSPSSVITTLAPWARVEAPVPLRPARGLHCDESRIAAEEDHDQGTSWREGEADPRAGTAGRRDRDRPGGDGEGRLPLARR